MSKGLAIIAAAAVSGTAFAAAVSLPALVTLGSDPAPQALPLVQAKRAPTRVVRAAPLPPPRAAHQRASRKRQRGAAALRSV
ncbi:MAG TPA: hypothetical protein VE757_05570, partial [Gaiellaceae bacterium]|nr:hypothetical protein [Gaiellaceae bacterium]